MAVNSRAKGKRGELEAAAKLRELFGWSSASRSAQHKASEDAADLNVAETPDLWWEIKRVARLNVPQTMREAAAACGRRCPVLLHRRDREADWLLTIRLQDLPRVTHAYESALYKTGSNETLVAEDVSMSNVGGNQGR